MKTGAGLFLLELIIAKRFSVYLFKCLLFVFEQNFSKSHLEERVFFYWAVKEALIIPAMVWLSHNVIKPDHLAEFSYFTTYPTNYDYPLNAFLSL